MPVEYQPPEHKPHSGGGGRYVRSEHIVVMERYLSEHPELEISKRCLVEGKDKKKYLKKGCIVHHKNYIPHDNRVENLCVYESSSEH